jgi:hypothetical protein
MQALAVSPVEDYLATVQKCIHQLESIAGTSNFMLLQFSASTGGVDAGYKSNNKKLNRDYSSVIFDSSGENIYFSCSNAAETLGYI